MKALGIVRKIDELGRVVIPKEIRDMNGWGPSTPLEVLATDEGILFREYVDQVTSIQNIIESASTVFKKVDRGYFVVKSKHGDLTRGRVYAEDFVIAYIRENSAVIV